jgi:hypothetical protein
MPQRTIKQPAAATEAPQQPEPPQPTARELRIAEIQRHLEAIQEARAFFDGMSPERFYLLLTFKQIIDNHRGCTTPVEEFISHLVWLWGREDENGQGLTVEDIESAMEQLREADLSEEIKNAHWMAARYPLPESKTPEATEEAASN